MRLTPSVSELHREQTRALELRATRLIVALPTVERAELALQLPRQDEAALDRPLPRPTATVVLAQREPRPLRGEIERVLSATVPAFEARDLTLVEPLPIRRESVESAVSLVQVGPFRVHRGSALALRVGLAFLLGSNALLSSILLWRTRRKPLAPRKVDPGARTRFPP